MPRRKFETDYQYDSKQSGVAGPRPYDVYTALLSQTAGLDPSATVLENTLPTPLTWTRLATGSYSGNSTDNIFTSGKTTLTVFNQNTFSSRSFYADIANSTVSCSRFLQYDSGSTACDGFTSILVDIRVYQ